MENKLQIAKEIVQKYYDVADCGIFFCRNTIGDEMTTVFRDVDLDLQIDVCYSYMYFEVFGLSSEEEDELEMYYDSLKGDERDE